MGNVDIKCRANLCLIEHGERGALHLAGELAAVAWVDAAVCVACYGCNLNGEVVPRADAFVAIVVYALSVEHIPVNHL